VTATNALAVAQAAATAGSNYTASVASQTTNAIGTAATAGSNYTDSATNKCVQTNDARYLAALTNASAFSTPAQTEIARTNAVDPVFRSVGLTGAVYAAQSGPTWSGGLLSIGTNSFGGGTGGSGVTNNTPSVAFGTATVSSVVFSYTAAATYSNTAQATGGTVSYVGGKEIHTFTNDGTFALVGGSVTASVLVVAGGGGGGCGGGGGGAGGLILTNSFVITNTCAVTIGAGGAGGTHVPLVASQNGSNSVFGTLTAWGGGRGGEGDYTASGGDGGSGGGAAWDSTANGVGTNGQGYAGGDGTTVYNSGGGGGAGSVGQTTPTALGGKGGTGVASSISGVSVGYAGGGGGGGSAAGGGGTASEGGGAGGGASTAGSNATENTGGGGGGGNWAAGYFNGGNGGAGVVIVSFPAIQTIESYTNNTITMSGAQPGGTNALMLTQGTNTYYLYLP
jgi:hypothetical protein